MMELKMQNWLDKRAALTPDRIAVIEEGRTFTFSMLQKHSMETANKLREVGVKEGDHIGILIQNNLGGVEIILALNYVGAVIVFLNNRLTSTELSWQISDSNAEKLIVDPELMKQALEIETSIPMISLDEIKAVKHGNYPVKKEISLNDFHSMIYTSGTTGNPKGVMLTYANHWWSAIGSSLNLGLHENDRWLMALPLFHVSGLSILIRSIIYGISIVVHKKFDPVKVNQSIRENAITMMSAVSTMLSDMLDHDHGEGFPDYFRCMLLGGGPAPKPLLEKCVERNIPVYQTYGMTETASQIVTLSSEYMLEKLGSAGKPLFPAQLKIVDDERELENNEPGEIIVKGPNVSTGYYSHATGTITEIQKGGWLYTGDIGYIDKEGFLYILDRRSDLIISGGENIYPAEIEAVLLSHKAVRDAGVIGKDHKKWGKVPIACIQLYPDYVVSKEDILFHCKQRLAQYKVPVEVHFLPELPRNAAKKLLRRKLKEILQER